MTRIGLVAVNRRSSRRARLAVQRCDRAVERDRKPRNVIGVNIRNAFLDPVDLEVRGLHEVGELLPRKFFRLPDLLDPPSDQ